MAGALIVTESKEGLRPAAQIRVQTVTSEREFLELERVWDQVTAAADTRNPFLEFAWAQSWWECFGGSAELHVLVLWDGADPIAIVPLMTTRVRMFGIPLRRLGFFYNSHVPRTDLLIARRPAECYRAIWRHLRACQWDLLQLCQLPEDSAALDEIVELAGRDGHPVCTWASSESPYVSLDGTWQEYQQTLTAKFRSNLRNRTKRLNQVGPVRMETIVTARDLGSALDEAFALEASAWKGEEGTAIACQESLRRFYRLFGERAAERGWLQLNFLRAGSRRVAFDYSLRYRDRILLLKLGYDAAFAPYSPSNLLLGEALEDAFARGLERYDFLGDFAEWKRCWAKDSVAHRWVFVFSKRVRGRLAHFAKCGLAPRWKALSAVRLPAPAISRAGRG
jgi:CelD/BcsL family acetyltransferase involved in cellulose biosynthesis